MTLESSPEILQHTIRETDVPGRAAGYRGKVRDIYPLSEDRLAMVITDRISAFDHVFHETIPCKGQLLNRLAEYGFRQVESVCRHHLLDVPHPNVTIVRRCEPIPVEVVMRGYLSGYSWRVYEKGGRTLCGAPLPEGMKQNQRFPEPLLTPSTKAREGHDEDISEMQIIDRGLVDAPLWDLIRETARKLFREGTRISADKGLLLVDTKYEFGIYENELYLIDEVHTADSSRYFYAQGYEQKLQEQVPQKQLSKEFLREWLIENGFHASLDQKLPRLPDEVRLAIYARYRELFETLTGETFVPQSTKDFNKTLERLLHSIDPLPV